MKYLLVAWVATALLAFVLARLVRAWRDWRVQRRIDRRRNRPGAVIVRHGRRVDDQRQNLIRWHAEEAAARGARGQPVDNPYTPGTPQAELWAVCFESRLFELRGVRAR
jgi:hypothetical protein